MNPDSTSLTLTPEQTALLIIDVQEKLLPAIFQRERVERNAATLIRAARVLNIPVVVTEQYPAGLGPTAGPLRAVLGDAPVIEKMTFSIFGEPEFVDALGGLHRRTLLVAGIEAHVCVTQSVLDALTAGYTVHVAADATSSRTEANLRFGLDRMRTAGAVVSCTEMALFELLRVAGTPAFKEVLKLIK